MEKKEEIEPKEEKKEEKEEKGDNVITNRKEEFERIKNLLQEEEIKNVKLEYKAKEDLLDLYDLESQIKKTEENHVVDSPFCCAFGPPALDTLGQHGSRTECVHSQK